MIFILKIVMRMIIKQIKIIDKYLNYIKNLKKKLKFYTIDLFYLFYLFHEYAWCIECRQHR